MAAPAATPVGEAISIVRLHGEACFFCGHALGRLFPVGLVETPVEGGTRLWPVVACVEHRDRRPS